MVISNCSEEIITQCDRCGQIKINEENNIWDGVKREVIRIGNYSHGPCPACFNEVILKYGLIKVEA